MKPTTIDMTRTGRAALARLVLVLVTCVGAACALAGCRAQAEVDPDGRVTTWTPAGR